MLRLSEAKVSQFQCAINTLSGDEPVDRGGGIQAASEVREMDL
jgi:hypothetical protein